MEVVGRRTGALDGGRVTSALACAIALGLAVTGCSEQTSLSPDGSAKAERPAPISVRTPADDELERRLNGIYTQISGLDEIRARIRKGVVHLTGATQTIALEQQAASLAARLEGVVYVDNEIVQHASIREKLAPTLRSLRNLGRATLALVPLLFGAIVVLVPFVLLSQLLRRWQHPLQRLGLRRLTGNLIRSALRGLVLIVGLLLALQVLGLVPHVGALVGTFGVLALVASLAFRDWVRNYLPGMMLGLHPPFSAGDLVQIGPREGRVVRITPRATVLMTTDGEEVRVPNVELFRESLINYSHHPVRRLRFTMQVSPTSDLRRAQQLGRRALLELDGVMHEPPPFMRTRTLERDSIEVEFFAWVDQARINFRTVESRARRAVFEALARGGIPLPEAQLTLRLPQGPLLDAPGETRGDDAEALDAAFLDQRLGRARGQARERDLLDEGRQPDAAAAARPDAETSPPVPRRAGV